MKKLISLLALLLPATFLFAQRVMQLQEILDSITVLHPVVKMFNNEIRSMDEAAKGARSWMAPQLGFGQFMTPYNVGLWHREGDIPGMGSVMFSGEQMFPNRKKLDADEQYMKAMSDRKSVV